MSGKPWTRGEKAVVRKWYLRIPASDIAERLPGRTIRSIYLCARSLGLRKSALPFDSATVNMIRGLHGQGLLDTDIAARIVSEPGARPIDRRTVCDIRRRLELPVNREARLERRRQSVRTQFARLGIKIGGELRKLSYCKFARENGWPEDLRPREVQILNVLAEHGPQTRLELALKLGLATGKIAKNGVPRLLHGNGSGGTYTASLAQRGLVFIQKRFTTGGGQGKNRLPNLYFLTPQAIEWRERHVYKQRSHNTDPGTGQADDTRAAGHRGLGGEAPSRGVRRGQRR